MITVAPIDATRWHDAVARFDARTVYHDDAWLGLLGLHYGEVMRLGTFEAGACTSLWPLVRVRKGPVTVVGSPLPGWNTPYLGPLFAPGVLPADCAAAVGRVAPLRHASYSELRVMAGADARFDPLGYRRLVTFDSLFVDLTADTAALWAGLDSSARGKVRKAEKNGFEVRVEEGIGFVDDLSLMATEVFGRWNLRPPFTSGFVSDAVTRLAAANQVVVISAVRGDDRGAICVVFHDHRTAYFHWHVSRVALRDTGLNSLLVWNAITTAKERGARCFDFVGGSGTAGAFKRSFGAKEAVACEHWGRSRTSLERVLKEAYERYVRRRLKT